MEINPNNQATPQCPSRLDGWRELIAERESSGLSIKEFCRERSMSSSKYYYWRDRVLGRSPRKQSRVRPKASQGFASVELGESLGGYRLEFPSGIIVEAKSCVGSGGVIELLKELGGLKDA